MSRPHALLVSLLDEDGDIYGWDDPGVLVDTVMALTDSDDVCVFGNEDRALIDFDWAWRSLSGVVQARHAEALLVTVPPLVMQARSHPCPVTHDWYEWLDELLAEVPEWQAMPHGVKIEHLYDADEVERLIAEHNDAYIDYHRALAEEEGKDLLAEQERHFHRDVLSRGRR